MFSKFAPNILRSGVRGYATAGKKGFNVAVLGASGGIGQPLSLLLKTVDHVSTLSLHDVVNTPGVAADLSHICTPTKMRGGFKGPAQLKDALEGMDVVVIPAGVPRKPGMTRDDLFNTNATIVRDLTSACAKFCPSAMILIISNPVNSTVPIAAETLKKAGVYNPQRLFGVTTLDVTRANTFVAESQGWNPRDTNVTVIGGHAGTTILPLLSQVKGAKFTQEQIKALSHRVQFGGDEVVNAKEGAGSATLSMAYSGCHFTARLLRAMAGEQGIVECTFTQNNVASVPFFASPTRLGPNGVEEVLPFGELSEFEKNNYNAMLPDLTAQIKKGVEFGQKN